jgi:hypothetical protein
VVGFLGRLSHLQRLRGDRIVKIDAEPSMLALDIEQHLGAQPDEQTRVDRMTVEAQDRDGAGQRAHPSATRAAKPRLTARMSTRPESKQSRQTGAVGLGRLQV